MIPHKSLTVLAGLLLASCTYIDPPPSAKSPSTLPALAEKFELDVWPTGHMPGTAATQPEHIETTGTRKGQITNVSHPTLTVFSAPASTPGPHPAVVICPGGAYSLLSWDLEGTEAATWLNSLGITAIVLKYRVPNNREGAFDDIQRAFRLVRAHQQEWNLDPWHIGGLGFSAGGHLVARLSTNADLLPTPPAPAYPAIDDIDKLSCRPDFVLLIYPAYLDQRGAVAPEIHASNLVPPTFMVHAEDDARYINSSKIYFAALEAAHADAELHLFPDGGHGFGLRSTKSPSVWPKLAEQWLQKEKILP